MAPFHDFSLFVTSKTCKTLKIISGLFSAVDYFWYYSLLLSYWFTSFINRVYLDWVIRFVELTLDWIQLDHYDDWIASNALVTDDYWLELG